MPNRLARESSPYLLQHANNPVEWFAWGEEAFAEARRRDVPILLSIGYSTCYWCHVMERESFESGSIAAVLNRSCVCVKVDREERPDVDDLYMAATLMLRGQGGWPMTVFLDPGTLRPFFAGTYFPPEPRGGMPSIVQVVEGMAQAWRDRRGDVERQAAAVAGAVTEHLAAVGAPVALGSGQITAAVQTLLQTCDRTNGGFGRAPKFPQPANLAFLLEVRPRAGDDSTADAIDAVLRVTLDRMSVGGLFDHAGGGFHRYSVDAYWTVPHFEKMLYDNALLASVYTRAARWFADEWYEQTARRTLGFMLREMQLSGGGFASAQDAEVDHREGLNYLWTPDEVRAVFADDPAEGEFAIRTFGLDESANFRDPHHPADPPRWVLRLEDRPERLARGLDMDPAEFQDRLRNIEQRLLIARGARSQPGCDDKVIAAWNGMAMVAFCEAAEMFPDPKSERDRWVAAARSVAGLMLGAMRDGEGGLRRSVRGSSPGPAGVLEDYAWSARGLLALARVDPDFAFAGRPARDHAFELLATANERFAHPTLGLTDAPERPDLFVRPRATHDGATPSGVSTMLHALLDAADAGLDSARERAIGLFRAVSPAIAESPISTVHATHALFRLLVSHAEAGARLAEGAPAETASEDLPQPVEIYADQERLVVGPDQPAELNLVLRIAPGYHVTAADAGAVAAGLSAFRVGLLHGGGVAVYADYPPALAWAADPSVGVYEGEVEIRVAVERAGEWTGRPMLGVWYQACTDHACMEPRVLELDVAIDRAG